MTFLVIRARSDRGVTKKIRDTMLMLNLTRVNHATLIPDNCDLRRYAAEVQGLCDMGRG